MQKTNYIIPKPNNTKRLLLLYLMIMLCFAVIGCGPSDEKVAQAQQKYIALSEANDAVAEAHQLINDASYDEALTTLQKEAMDLSAYNLEEMKDEDIDALIHTMDALLQTYDNFLTTLTEVKAAEDAAVLVTIPVTLINNTSLDFQELYLLEQGDTSGHANLLTAETPFTSTQTITGLIIRRDVQQTPWIILLTDTDGTKWELPLAVENFTEEGITLALSYDAESETLKIGKNVPTPKENT